MQRRNLLYAVTVALALIFMTGFNVTARQIETVYTMSNATTGNAVLAFLRRLDGTLGLLGAFPTGGLGTGGSLGNQSGIVLDPNDRWLFVVNAGDGTISSFRVLELGLELVDTIASEGVSPISLTVFGTLVYVLNEGNENTPDNISGFTFDADGTLTPIPDSTRPLSDDLTDPAQISFNQHGTVLVVAEKATNMITTYRVDPSGVLSAPLSRPSARPTPFGFQFGDRDVMFMSEANSGGTGVVVAYGVDRDTGVVSNAIDILETESATCWVVLSPDQTVGYASNTESASISLFQINFDGSIEPLPLSGRSTPTGNGPLDLVLTQDGRNLYSLDSADQTISAFHVRPSGRITALGTVPIPPGANGLAAR